MEKTTHGRTGSSIYTIWMGIKQRCTSEGSPAWKYYGGRGIKMCDRWINSFENFLEDVGEKPFDSAQLDRTDNNGNYEPSNVRWVTPAENMNNRRPKSEWSESKRNKNGTEFVSFSIRLPKSQADRIEEVALESSRSRNKIISMLLDSGLIAGI